jgi:hypothetical protein
MDYEQIYLEEHVKNGLTYSQIREKYNIPRGTWDYHVRKTLGYKNDGRKYRANDDFFDVIDSEIKAYLLGFLYADGYISADGRIGVLLNEKDIEIMNLIHDFIAPNSEIKHLNYQNFKRDPQVKIRFKSKQIYKRLQEFGFTTDKTHHDCDILSKIPEDFKRHFIRGYCDGDGSICYNMRVDKRDGRIYPKLGITFCNGVPKILEEIKDYINLPAHFKQHESWYTLSYYKKSLIKPICELLYNNCTYYLKRKYEAAMNIIKYCNNTELNSEIKESESV